MTPSPTLQKFQFPGSVVAQYDHWVVMIRPQQITPLSCILATRSCVTSLAQLSAAEAAQLPKVIAAYERAVRRCAPALKFNYLALMMVDPNPHFHAIPRYTEPFEFDGLMHIDADFPKPPSLSGASETQPELRDRWRDLLAERWID